MFELNEYFKKMQISKLV